MFIRVIIDDTKFPWLGPTDHKSLGIPVIYEAAIIDNVVKLQFARANTHHLSIRVGEYDRYRLW